MSNLYEQEHTFCQFYDNYHQHTYMSGHHIRFEKFHDETEHEFIQQIKEYLQTIPYMLTHDIKPITLIKMCPLYTYFLNKVNRFYYIKKFLSINNTISYIAKSLLVTPSENPFTITKKHSFVYKHKYACCRQPIDAETFIRQYKLINKALNQHLKLKLPADSPSIYALNILAFSKTPLCQ